MSGYSGGGGSTFTGGTITSPILAADGTAGAPSFSFTNDTNSGMYNLGTSLEISQAGARRLHITTTALGVETTSGQIYIGATGLQGIATPANGVVEVNAGAPGTNGWLLQRAARIGLAGNYTNATAALSATNLSITVVSGRKYSFLLELFLSNTTAAEGVQITFDGGSAAATNFVANGCLVNNLGGTVALANGTSAALATALNATALTNTSTHNFSISGSFEPSGAGTFIVRAAENTHSTGTLTILRGSFLWIEDMVFG